jgi:hypothetical protein
MKRALLILSIMGVFSTAVFATPVPSIQIQWDEGSWEKTYGPGDMVGSGSEYYLEDQMSGQNALEASWNLTFDADPYVISWVSMMNTDNVAHTYTVTFSMDVDPVITPTSLYGGSVGGSLSTDPAGGFVSTVASVPLYLGLIDGVGVLSLYSHPSSWTRVSGGTTIIGEVSAGLPGPTLLGGPVMTSITIQHKFTLGAHDAVSLTGYFEVIPEPATVVLLGLGGMIFLRKRIA